ncbi:MAG: hypothetical protein CVU10_02820 [Bacteroidetes bacterium HGW-Bacteroidetes-5]|jgi:hypothetical protein|nr:MAG: hypothetical protein CVU10_02820 [Bacteroidetes bacterium HGW-Bacteroidetes-5]
MANLVKYTLGILILSAYFVTSPGFGIHVCSKEGTRDLILLSSNTSCDDIHSHCGCSSGSCTGTKHDNNCCETEIHHLDSEYNIVEITSNTPVHFSVLDNAIFTFEEVALFNLQLGYKYTEIRHGPDIPHSKNICSYISQWRL